MRNLPIINYFSSKPLKIFKTYTDQGKSLFLIIYLMQTLTFNELIKLYYIYT